MTNEQIKLFETIVIDCAKKLIAGETSHQDLDALANAASALAQLHKC